jgi:hypothetical protein
MGVAKVIAHTRALEVLELMRLCGELKQTRQPVLSSALTAILTHVNDSAIAGSYEYVSSIRTHATFLNRTSGPATTTIRRNAVRHYPTNRLTQLMKLGKRKLLMKMEWVVHTSRGNISLDSSTVYRQPLGSYQSI